MLLSKLRASVDQRNAHGVRHAAHQLGGSIRLFSATRASELALRLESMGRDGKLEKVGDCGEPADRILGNSTENNPTHIDPPHAGQRTEHP